MSNGAMMSHRLGIELSDTIAAIGPVVGTLFGDEAQPVGPVSAIMINGMLDESVPYYGGPTGGRGAKSWDGTPAKPAIYQAAFWARANDCDEPHSQADKGTFLLAEYHCPSGRSVKLYSVKDNAHAWPGGLAGSRRGATPSTAIDATDLIWKFFKTHPKNN